MTRPDGDQTVKFRRLGAPSRSTVGASGAEHKIPEVRKTELSTTRAIPNQGPNRMPHCDKAGADLAFQVCARSQSRLRTCRRPEKQDLRQPDLIGTLFRNRFTIAVAFAILITVIPARAQNTYGDPADGAPAPSAPSGSSSMFYPEGSELTVRSYDVLRVEVFDVPELSRECTVSRSGSIALPLLSTRIRAAGLTPAELSVAVTNALRAAGLVSNPHVSVQVKKSRLHSVVIGGAVKRPQIYSLFDHISLLDALAQAGGLSRDAGNFTVITRGQNPDGCGQGAACGTPAVSPTQHETQSPTGIGPVKLIVDLRQLLATDDPHLNIELYPGDTVTVQRAGIVYVVGAVNRPGGFPLTGDGGRMSVLKAIALAEGLKSTAIRKRSMIIHDGSSPRPQQREFVFNLGRVFAGQAPDPSLEAGEILFIPDSTSQKALRRAAEAAVEITTGVIIFR